MAKLSEDFKSGYKDVVGCCVFSILRRAERRLSPQAIYSALKPVFYARAMMNCAFRRRTCATDRPEFLQVPHPARVERKQRMNKYSGHVLEFFQDRLSNEKWMSRCRIEGLEHLQAARREGRPTIVTLCHFGHFYFVKHWLRARGFPVAGLWGRRLGPPSPLSRLKEGIALLPWETLTLHNDELRAVHKFLNAGNILVVPIDSPVGKQIDVPFCDGWTFQMTAGAIRFAIRHQAALMPSLIVDEGSWRFSLTLGRPVPPELLAVKDDWSAAAKYLVDEMMPVFRAHPEQCRPDFIRRLKRNHPAHADIRPGLPFREVNPNGAMGFPE